MINNRLIADMRGGIMKNILVIQTGGTIGSSDLNGVVALTDKSQNLFKQFANAKFTLTSPYKILSENLREKHFEILIKNIAENLNSNFDGIIILHGSDTLAYTSSILGLFFAGCSKPIIVTASNKPPKHPKSNAFVNLKAAVKVAETFPGGVYTTWQNLGENCKVYLATRVRSADVFSDSFSGIDTPLGEMADEKIIPINQNLFKQIKLSTSSPLNEIPHFKNKIGLIAPYPGFDFKSYNTENVAAVLLTTYHSSTAPTDSENSALHLLEKLKNEGKMLYLAPVKSGTSLYETTKKLITDGAIPLGHITPETAYTKLLLTYNTKGIVKENFLKSNRYFEMKEKL